VIGLTCFCAKSFLLRGMLSRNRVVREDILALLQCYFFFLSIKKFLRIIIGLNVQIYASII
jgi:hypothetical protein